MKIDGKSGHGDELQQGSFYNGGELWSTRCRTVQTWGSLMGVEQTRQISGLKKETGQVFLKFQSPRAILFCVNWCFGSFFCFDRTVNCLCWYSIPQVGLIRGGLRKVH